ncbi:MAG: hypothetical protein ABEH56_07485 [Salinirussus sp.]
MTVSRRTVCRAGVGLIALGSVTSAVSAQRDELQLREVDLPETITLGNTFAASLTVKNKGEEPVSTSVEYTFEGGLIASMDLTIEPGETRSPRLAEMNSEWLAEEVDGPLEPGVYVHGIGLRNGPREEGEVEILPADESGGEQEPTENEGPPQGLELLDRQIPRTLERGAVEDVGVTVRNVRSSPITVDMIYTFEGEPILSERGIEIPPNEGVEVYREVSVSKIEESLGDRLEPGTYEHSFGLPDGPRIREQLRIVGTSGTSTEAVDEGSQTLTPEATAAPETEQPDDQRDAAAVESAGRDRQRGFLSNSGDEPAFISNPLNLTTIGFLLSVAGIAHQLLQGR